MITLSIEDHIRKQCPELRIATIECEVINSGYHPELWAEITQFEEEFRSSHSIDQVNKRPAIAATRSAYKKLGKDPNRYRPSAEALCRRVLRELPLYQINTLVDLINLISLRTGYSIGGFDADRIQGNPVLGVGMPEEEFHAIGRGLLNIEGLPVYRDSKGAIGTPTSDEERTKIGLETKRLFMIINAYSGEQGLDEAIKLSRTLLVRYMFNNENKDLHLNLY